MSNKCLACGSDRLVKILDFGLQPAANLLTNEPCQNVTELPLALMHCEECGHAQQKDFYSPEFLFSDYLYASGTSNTLKKYFLWLASRIASFPGAKLKKILEIASNDGSFLEALKLNGLTATGVEPASNLAEESKKKGFTVINKFWPAPEAGKADLVVAMNVLAHNADPLVFLRSIHDSLNDDGVALIQTSQIDMFENSEFDTLYHEHYSFFCPNSFCALARRAGFQQMALLKTSVHGGSLLGVISKGPDVTTLAEILSQGNFAAGMLDPTARPSQAMADNLAARATRLTTTIGAIASLVKSAGIKLVMVGAAAKAITVLQASHLYPDFLVDEAPLKIGRHVPCTDIRIEPFSVIETIRQPCFFLIGAWNFYDELRKKIRKARPRCESDFIAAYFPDIKIEPLFPAPQGRA